MKIKSLGGNSSLVMIEYTDFFKPSNVKAYFSTRLGGFSEYPYTSLNFGRATKDHPSSIKRNYDLFYQVLKGEKRHLYANQVHGNQVFVDSGNESGCIGDYDAIVSRYSDCIITTYHADCYPVYFFSKKNNLIGLAHAGWKGVYQEIVKEVMTAFKKNATKELDDLKVVIGPGICAEHYQVEEALARKFELKFGEKCILLKEKMYYLDLKTCIVSSLQDMGISEADILHHEYCTFQLEEYFYSYRRNQFDAGRMLATIIGGE